MESRQRNFIKRGIIIPLIIAVIITILFFASYKAVISNFAFSERDIVLADYSNSQVVDAEPFSGNSKMEMPYQVDNTVIGTAFIGSQSMPIILESDGLNSAGRLNISRESNMIGEAGSAFLYCNKKDNPCVKLLNNNDIIEIDMYYGSYEYKVVDTKTVKNEAQLKRCADGIGSAIVIYTDSAVGVGVGNDYYAVICEIVSGTTITE